LLLGAGALALRSSKGQQRKQKLKTTYIWQMATKWGSFFLKDCFYGVFVRFLTRGVQKHHEQLFGGNPCQKPLAEKAEKKRTIFRVVFSLRFSVIASLAVSLHEEPKNTIKKFSKIRPENRKQSRKKW
jgi:hypothetical protein